MRLPPTSSDLPTGPHGRLSRRLAEPTLVGGFDDLPALWRRTVITLRCRSRSGFEEGPWTPGQIRGALGRRLAASVAAERSRIDPFDRPAAYEVLFNLQGNVTRRSEIPKPFVIAVDREGAELIVRITLFGLADYWRNLVRDAAVAALQGGIRNRERKGLLVRLDCLSSDVARHETVNVPDPRSEVILRFVTPLCIQSGRVLKGNIDDLPFALAERVNGMARWQDVKIEADWSRLRDLTKAVTVRSVDLIPVQWERRTLRCPDTSVPMRGLIGRCVLEGEIAPFMSVLALGETCHAGAHGALGLGRYILY